MTVLMLAVVPVLLRQNEQLARSTETRALLGLADGLRDYVQTSRRIPGTNTLIASIAGQLGWLPSAVERTARGHARAFIVDPALRVGNPAGGLPYVQGTNGSVPPVNPRLMIISTMAAPLPTNLVSGASTSTNTFAQIWDSAEGTAPVGWDGGGTWDDYLIQRVNLETLFVPLVLNNNAVSLGRYSVDSTNAPVELPANPFSAHFIAGTALGLHGSDGVMQARLVLQDNPQLTNGAPGFVNQSFVYEKGVWRGRLFMTTDAQKHNGVDLQSAYEIFMSGPPNVYKVGSVNQSTLTQKMYLFMSNYVLWASNGFPAGGKAVVSAAQSAMAAEVGTYCNKKASSD